MILESCAWKLVGWLKNIEARPEDGGPLRGMTRHKASTALTALTEEIADLLARSAPTTKPDHPHVIPPTAPPADISTPPVGPGEAQDVSEAITELEGDSLKDLVPASPAHSNEIPDEQNIPAEPEVPLKLSKESTPETLLFSYRWLKAKLRAAGLTSLVNDFALLPENAEATQVAAALLLSARVLASNPEQLAGQLHGRLKETDGAQIKQLLTDARLHVERWSILPIRPTLTRPEPRLIWCYIAPKHGNILAVLPNGRRVLSGLPDGTLRLWDLESGRQLGQFEGWSKFSSWLFDYKITAVAISADAHLALSGLSDGTIRLWNLETKAKLRQLA